MVSGYVSCFHELHNKKPEEIRAFVLTKQHELRKEGRAFAEWYFHGDYWLEELDELALIPLDDVQARDKKKQRICFLIDAWLNDYYQARVYIEKKRRERERAKGII